MSWYYNCSNVYVVVSHTSPVCARWLVTWHRPLLEEVVPRWGQKWSEWSSVGPGASTCLSDEPKHPWNCEKKTQNCLTTPCVLPMSSTPFNLETKLNKTQKWGFFDTRRQGHLNIRVDRKLVAVADNTGVRLIKIKHGSGTKLDHRPFNPMWARSQLKILKQVPVGCLD